MKERAELEDLLDSEAPAMGADRRRAEGGPQGLRRRQPGRRPAHRLRRGREVEEVPFEAMIEREPITVICSKMGWIRAMKGHQPLDAEVKFKDGDEGRVLLPRRDHRPADPVRLQRPVLHAVGRQPARRARHGRAGAADGRPAERGRDRRLLRRSRPAASCWSPRPRATASSSPRTRCVAQTRAGKQVLNLGPRRARHGLPAGRRATMSPASARTARCWSSRSTNCPR